MAASASVAVARLGGCAHYWGRVGADALGHRITDELADEGVDVSTVRRVAGCVSPSAAILVAADGERLVCAYNDPKLDHDPSWLPLHRVGSFSAVLVDVRWPAGAAAVLDAARAAGVLSVLDADIGTAEIARDLARRASYVAFSEPGLAQQRGSKNRVGASMRRGGHRRHSRRDARTRGLSVVGWEPGTSDRGTGDHRGRHAGARGYVARGLHARAWGRTVRSNPPPVSRTSRQPSNARVSAAGAEAPREPRSDAFSTSSI
jgi:hypothetical protein